MSNQNASNHARLITLWHRITPLLILALLVGSIINLCKSSGAGLYSASLILLIILVMIIFYWYIRAFALKAQDRAIRAEENFRHFILTGKPLDRGLRMRQIIALRFAPDDEMPALVQRAVSEKLTSKQIKQAIKNWKPDYNRV